MMTNFQQAKRQIQHQIQQQQHCYTTLPTGWGCSCPEAKSIQSKQECASAADSLLPERNRYKLPQEQQQGNVSQETNANGDAVNDQDNTPSIQVYENQWQYGPCGCFFWKNDQKVYYTGDRTNEMHCIAVEWAELICRTSQGESSKNDTDIDVMEVTEIVEEKYLDLNNIFAIGRNPEEHPRKCLDWYIFKPLHVSVDRRYCLGFDIPPLLPATNDQNHDGTSMKKVISHNTTFPAYLKKCADIELYYDTWLYNNLQIMTRHQTYGFVYCLQVNGTNDTNGSEESDALSSQVTVGICNGSYPPYVENPAQQWVFDSRGRFRNVLNGQFLSVHGSTVGNNCYHALKEGDLIVTTDSSMNNGCDFTSWSVSLNTSSLLQCVCYFMCILFYVHTILLMTLLLFPM